MQKYISHQFISCGKSLLLYPINSLNKPQLYWSFLQKKSSLPQGKGGLIPLPRNNWTVMTTQGEVGNLAFLQFSVLLMPNSLGLKIVSALRIWEEDSFLIFFLTSFLWLVDNTFLCFSVLMSLWGCIFHLWRLFQDFVSPSLSISIL